jgi:glycerol-3-phosphate dehydrogenase (NAD(P)+)
MNQRVTILGAGSWGIANANLLTKNGADVIMWEFDHRDLALLLEKREHPQKLPGVRIHDSIRITGDLAEAMESTQMVAFAIPAQNIAPVCRQLSVLDIPAPALVINLSKGIEEVTLRRGSQVIGDEWLKGDRSTIVALSGPSHAEEVAQHLPTSVVVAGNQECCLAAQKLYSNETFRVYRTPDIIGVELGGSLKNIIAIGAGIAHGLGFGDNTQGALITRGLVEINRLAVDLGAQPETIAGLSGVGDLITTCISTHSRNQYLGYHIGRGKTLEQILAGMVMVAEGVTTCRSARELARRHSVEMPITEAVYAVLFERLPPREAVTSLMTRPLKEEVWQ